MQVQKAIDAHYTPEIQISRGQAYVIGSAIASFGERANVLVFGCGNDSAMWAAMNPGGRTLFLENHPKWLERVRKRNPQLEIQGVDYGERTVSESLPLDEAALKALPPPPILSECRWDVILIDSPMGAKPHMPGRSLPIYWASLVAAPTTHVFIDDYRRPVERAYADHFFRSRRTWNYELPMLLRHGVPHRGLMLWSLGVAPEHDGSQAVQVAAPARDEGAAPDAAPMHAQQPPEASRSRGAAAAQRAERRAKLLRGEADPVARPPGTLRPRHLTAPLVDLNKKTVWTLEKPLVVQPDWVIFADGRAMRVGHRSDSIVARSKDSITVSIRKPIRRLRGELLFVGGHWNHYQNVVKHLLPLYHLRDLLSEGAPLLVHDAENRILQDVCARLGIDAGRLVSSRDLGTFRPDRLSVPRKVIQWGGVGDTDGLNWFRSLYPAATPLSKRIYISRRRAKSRHIENEGELLDALSPLGFEVVELEAMTFAEQAVAFKSAAAVVGPHGAGFTNTIFTAPGAVVHEFIPDQMPGSRGDPRSFANLARIGSLHYSKTVCHADFIAPAFRIDVGDAVRTLIQALERQEKAAS